MVSIRYISECCGVVMPDYPDSDFCPKCKEHTTGVVVCPKCLTALNHFSGLETMPEGDYCPACNDVLYDEQGVIICQLV